MNKNEKCVAEVGKDVGFEMVERSIGSFERDFTTGQFACCFNVRVHFVVEAAFEFCTLSSQFLWVGRDVLETRSGS